MITFESFVLYNLAISTIGWFLMKRQGEQEYDNGFMDAVQLHSEGRLTYNVETIGDDKCVLTIEVSDED
jgi:hypothetical protein